MLVALSACSPQCGPKTSGNPSPSPSVVAATPSATATPTPTPTPTPVETPTPSPSPTPTPAPLFITRQNLPLHVGEVGVGFAPAPLGAVGGTPPYTWSIGGGALAPGLTLSPSGTVSGTPTANGSFGFTLLLTDSAGAAAGFATSVSVLPHVALSGLCTQQCSVESGCVTVCGAFSDISGGVQPYSFALTGGAIPPGMTLNGLALAGTFPAQTGTFVAAPPPFIFTFTVGVTDALGATASVNAVFNIFQHIATQGGTIGANPNAPCGFGGTPQPNCTVSLPYFGGTPGGTPTASFKWIAPFPTNCTGNPAPNPCAPLPPLPTVTVSGGNVTIAAGPGDCQTWCNGYTATLQVVLTDQSPCAPGPVMCSSAPVQVTITEGGG